ncbi:MAG: hypothetical protein ABSH19_05110 [Opitutales bacterium]|jgi:type IV secretory pathway VirB10-like protein
MKLKGLLALGAFVLVAALLAGLWLAGYWDKSRPLPKIAVASISPQQSPPAAATPAPPAPEQTDVSPPQPAPEPEPAAENPPPEPPMAPTQPAAEDTASTEDAVLQQQVKEATNNLRQLASASQQYMLDKGVTQASYYDLVGTSTDSYIRSIAPAADENYDDTIIYQTTTQISISSSSFGTVTYNL